MIIEPRVAQRIAMLRTLLILSIVLLHAGGPSMRDLDYSSWAAVIRFFFQNTLARLGVPTLTLVSGYLLFRAHLDRDVPGLYKKKLQTLVVPFLFFNVAYFLLLYGTEYATGWAPLYHLVDLPPARLVDAIVGYDGVPLNPALHFLRDLIVLMILAPLFGFFLRRGALSALTGFVLVVTLFMGDVDRHLVNRNTMAVLFYVGGWLAVNRHDMTACDRYSWFALGLLVLVCAATVAWRMADHTWVYLAGPFAVWIAAAPLPATAVGQWAIARSNYSFFLFLAHMPLLRVLSLARHKYVPALPDLLYVPAACVLTVLIVFGVYDLAMRWWPTFFNGVIGGRSARGGAAPTVSTAAV